MVVVDGTELNESKFTNIYLHRHAHPELDLDLHQQDSCRVHFRVWEDSATHRVSRP